MALTSAERGQRHRAHHRGDHSLCDPQTCGDARVPPAHVVDEDEGTRGDQLAAALLAERALSPAERALAAEAGRLVDRLDRLHEHLADRHWLRFEVGELSERGAVTVIVKCDRVLAEARQQQLALVSTVAELRQHRPAAKAEPPGKSKGAGLADLIRLADRR